LILADDAEVRFGWIMLGREARSTHELLMATIKLPFDAEDDSRRPALDVSPKAIDTIDPIRMIRSRMNNPSP
jgi:hypothetical protein